MAVFDLPMIADMTQQLVGRDPRGIEACQKIATVMRYEVTVGGEHVAIDAQADPTVRKSQLLANIIGVVQAQPEPASIRQKPFFSQVSAAGGRPSACPKQERKASSTSG